jgi:hypothetical protein
MRKKQKQIIKKAAPWLKLLQSYADGKFFCLTILVVSLLFNSF